MVKGNVSKKGEDKKSDRLDPGSRGRSKSDAQEPQGLIGFLKGARQELDKVVWPSRQQLFSESVAVLMIVLAFASFVFLIDQAFSWIASQIFV